MSKLNTTKYNESSVNSESVGYMTLNRWPNSYGFKIFDNGGSWAYIEIGSKQAERLVKNLTEMLKINKHIKK